jgi:radial spoke head protein 4A
MEPRGSGVNKNVYYVTSDLSVDWIELGDARPIHIKAAREIRYLLTGELDTKIVSNPHFPGLEKDYLRCQIARIVQSTTIMPDGMFKPSAENPIGFDPIDEAKPLKTKDLIYLKNWVHSIPHILNQGRIQHKEIEPPADHPNPDKFKEEYIAKDPFEKVLRAISDDKSLTSSFPKIKIPAWKIQFLYDDKIYINSNITNPEKDNTYNYTIIVIRSLRWPGLYVVRYKNETYHLYFGWGHKFIDTNMGERFVYEKFPIINSDPEEIKTCAEPNEPKEVAVVNNDNPVINPDIPDN